MARFFRSPKNKLSEVIGDYSMAASRRNDAPGNIRAGRFVISSRTNILTDEESDVSDVMRTVRILVRRKKDGMFLCVSDHDDSFKVGFPGGRIDPGETPEEAATRELWEETGLIADSLRLVDSGVFMGKEVSLFVASDIEGKLKSSEEGLTGWCSIDTLTAGFFGEYYSKIFKKLGYL